MTFLGLPNELIIEVAKAFGPDAKTLSHLLCTNSRLKFILTPLLHHLAVQDRCGMPAIHWAAWRGHLPLLNLVLDMGADVNLKLSNSACYGNVSEISPLHWAVTLDKIKVAKTLLARGAYIDLQDENGNTPLFWAVHACKGKLDMVKLLLEKGASTNIQDEAGRTVLFDAVVKENSQDMVQLLLEGGASIDIQCTSGMTALCWAAHDGAVDMVQFLLDKGASIEIQDSRGDTAFFHAVFSNNVDLVQLLLDQRASVISIDKQDYLPCTPLSCAVGSGNMRMVKLLADKGANLELINQSSWYSPGYWHASKQFPIAEFLLENGVDSEFLRLFVQQYKETRKSFGRPI